MRHKTRTNLFIDIILLIVFLIVYEEKATGTAIHEWLGIVLGLIFIVHIILHWKWLVTSTKKFLSRLRTESRINFMLDILIYIGFTTIIFSGIMISESFLPTFGIRPSQNHFWKEIHFLVVDITLFITALHFALHWKWIVNNFKRYIINPLKGKVTSDNPPKQTVVTKSASFNSSKLVIVSFQVLIILFLSGLISFGWYAASGTNPTQTYNREFRHQRDRNMESNFRRDGERRFERRGGNHRGRHDGSRHREEQGFFRIDLLKNLLIFFILTVLVITIRKMTKNKGLTSRINQSRT